MEKYVKLENVINLIDRLAKEPAYQHAGEDWHNGVCSVGCEVCSLPAVELVEQALEAEWVPEREGFLGSDYRCSNCGTLADESNSGHCSVLTKFCKHCGRKMKHKEN